MNANSTTTPSIVDTGCDSITNRSEIYRGVYYRASINFYAFNAGGSCGITAGINNFIKVCDAEPLRSKSRAEDDFAVDDDDFLS